MPSLAAIAAHLDALLGTEGFPDYPPALNGVQIENRGEIRKIAAAVDCSLRTIEGAITADANLLLVHHGAFWGGLQRLRGVQYERVRTLLVNDVALYASHLPLDAHPTVGNNVLLARALGLEPTGAFTSYGGVSIGVRGECELPTAELISRARAFAHTQGGEVLVSPVADGRRSRRWGISTGGGASADSLREALTARIDTMIVGEGPHHTAVDAADSGLAIIYAGHYATETLGVRALAEHAAETFRLPWTFIEAPTGL